MENKLALIAFLKEQVFPQLAPAPYGDVQVHRLASPKPVYLFTESCQRLVAVGKIYQYGSIPLDLAWTRAEREYANLTLARDEFGLREDPFSVVKPLGKSKELSALLVTQKAEGQLLDHYILRAIYELRRPRLFEKLGYLAQFFARLHAASRTETPVSPGQAQGFLDKLLARLGTGFLSQPERQEIEHHAGFHWNKKEVAGGDREVFVHGDATPTNFFFHFGKVAGIDLEDMKQADRCWDLGFLAAELKHHFYWRTGDRWAGEPFIGHFLWEYAKALSSVTQPSTGALSIQDFFHLITRKLPLFMALGLLRIARDNWLDFAYRKKLLEEAKLCLQYGR